jgi:hypothetical protein
MMAKAEQGSFLINSIPVGICLMDKQGKVEFANISASILFEPMVGGLIGKDSRDIFPPEIAVEMYGNDLAILKGEKQLVVNEYTFGAKGKLERSYLVHKMPRITEGGVICGVLTIFWDITESVQKEFEQSERLKTLENSYKYFNNSAGKRYSALANTGIEKKWKDGLINSRLISMENNFSEFLNIIGDYVAAISRAANLTTVTYEIEQLGKLKCFLPLFKSNLGENRLTVGEFVDELICEFEKKYPHGILIPNIPVGIREQYIALSARTLLELLFSLLEHLAQELRDENENDNPQIYFSLQMENLEINITITHGICYKHGNDCIDASVHAIRLFIKHTLNGKFEISTNPEGVSYRFNFPY